MNLDPERDVEVDVDVDLGPIPFRQAGSVRVGLTIALHTMLDEQTRTDLEQVKAMLDYKMSKAEFVAMFAEPS